METSKFQRSGNRSVSPWEDIFSIAAILDVQGCLARWWLNQPILKKYATGQIGANLPRDAGVNIPKNI